MCTIAPAAPNEPLLVFPPHKGGEKPKTVTVRWLAAMMRFLLTEVGADSSVYSLHSLRRGGATQAYQAGVDFLSIKRHGKWHSEAFWAYVTAPKAENSKVAKAFQSLE